MQQGSEFQRGSAVSGRQARDAAEWTQAREAKRCRIQASAGRSSELRWTGAGSLAVASAPNQVRQRRSPRPAGGGLGVALFLLLASVGHERVLQQDWQLSDMVTFIVVAPESSDLRHLLEEQTRGQRESEAPETCWRQKPTGPPASSTPAALWLPAQTVTSARPPDLESRAAGVEHWVTSCHRLESTFPLSGPRWKGPCFSWKTARPPLLPHAVQLILVQVTGRQDDRNKPDATFAVSIPDNCRNTLFYTHVAWLQEWLWLPWIPGCHVWFPTAARNSRVEVAALTHTHTQLVSLQGRRGTGIRTIYPELSVTATLRSLTFRRGHWEDRQRFLLSLWQQNRMKIGVWGAAGQKQIRTSTEAAEDTLVTRAASCATISVCGEPTMFPEYHTQIHESSLGFARIVWSGGSWQQTKTPLNEAFERFFFFFFKLPSLWLPFHRKKYNAKRYNFNYL